MGAAAGAAAGAAVGAAIGNAIDWLKRKSCSEKLDDVCYQLYLAQTADCGERHTDDRTYERCMEVAWLNYQRCKDNMPPIPLP